MKQQPQGESPQLPGDLPTEPPIEPDRHRGIPIASKDSPISPGDSPESSDAEPDSTINAVSTSPPGNGGMVGIDPGLSDPWWTDAMAVTDGLDTLVDGLDNKSPSRPSGELYNLSSHDLSPRVKVPLSATWQERE